MTERITANNMQPDIFDESDYFMENGKYKAGCIIEIIANPIVHIFKNVRWIETLKTGNVNKVISVSLFI